MRCSMDDEPFDRGSPAVSYNPYEASGEETYIVFYLHSQDTSSVYVLYASLVSRRQHNEQPDMTFMSMLRWNPHPVPGTHRPVAFRWVCI